MEEPETEIKSFKKKKKFVYLDKYEAYKETTDDKIKLMQKSINICYAVIGGLAIAVALLALAITK